MLYEKIFDVVSMLTAKYILGARTYTVGYSYTKTYTLLSRMHTLARKILLLKVAAYYTRLFSSLLLDVVSIYWTIRGTHQ